MDRIAYHPIRVSPHASLFLPLSQQELKVYQTECLNTLRVFASSDGKPGQSDQQPDSHINNTDDTLLAGHLPSHVEPDVGSPVGYTTPSPLSIPLSSCPAPHHADDSQPSQRPVTNKRSYQSIGAENDDSTDAPPNMPHFPKRTRHLAHPDSQSSISDTVAQHYNMRPNLTKGARTESPIFGLRKFNNWVKSVTIGKFASIESPFMSPLLSRNTHRQQQHHSNSHSKYSGTKILELGCGKGGDLAKWQNAGVRELYGFDIAAVSIEQAQSRYQENCSQRFYAKFVALDCFSLPIDSVLSPEELREPFHAVSLQFCMHYAFESEAKARTMMENVSKYLVSGGVMIGTIPDPDLLIQRWERCSRESNAEKPSFGNSVYEIRFPYPLTPQRRELDQVYGNRYSFYLEDAVEDVPEYLVLWEPFVRLAQEFGLKLVYKKGFHELFQTEKANPSYKSLLFKMKVINSEGNLMISSDQWDATGIYSAFAFIKM
ncbi:hypothetical protein PTTG_03640 [Puccinia triticina 1-1 BBBD Race 1]|uniref:mRNA cap guanine-N(7) methyltransferase n=2 Tax=Puccinia triticina TaxID=208348 RepID=A0A0C4ES66_PUCT1|nr:hypothetical protein PTTG_03640 [Puccinia triticina 1-1 BBBD Race 1]